MKKLVIVVVSMFILCSLPLSVFAYDMTDDGLYYDMTEDELLEIIDNYIYENPDEVNRVYDGEYVLLSSEDYNKHNDDTWKIEEYDRIIPMYDYIDDNTVNKTMALVIGGVLVVLSFIGGYRVGKDKE